MERHSLRLTIVLGVLITALGSTGTFAVFTDRVTSGWNVVQSGARPQAVDVALATATLTPEGPVSCGAYQHQMVSGLVHVEDAQPVEYSDADIAYACVKNLGSASIEVEATVIDLIDIDMGCTGDEVGAGDTGCDPNDPGELSVTLAVQMEQLDCTTGASTPLQSRSLADWATLSTPLAAPLAPDEVACIAFHVWIPASNEEAVLQLAQSDEVDWQFAFDAALPS